MIVEFQDGTKYDDELLIMNKDELLICRRNELVPENPPVLKNGIEGLLEYRLNRNRRHPDCIYQGMMRQSISISENQRRQIILSYCTGLILLRSEAAIRSLTAGHS